MVGVVTDQRQMLELGIPQVLLRHKETMEGMARQHKRLRMLLAVAVVLVQ